MESIGEFEYNTKDLIGHGAFAVVFKGRHKARNTLVAIKSITKKNLAKSQNLLGKEIKILKELTELHHENVVALLDCKETAHHVYLVMEFCNGGDLADYLHAKGTLSEDTIRVFLRQIAGAMRALYAKGVVHRDLKPQNILLCHTNGRSNPSPSDIILKIADFGFARFLQDGVMAATLCGSPMYMAPEVIMSLQYDAKADLWSIGTIVFQCLTGKAPFQAQTPQALKQYYEKNANLVPKIPEETSSDLTNMLLRLLKRNATDRMDFNEFFTHPFLKMVNKLSSPMPVPSRRGGSNSPGSLSPCSDNPNSPRNYSWDGNRRPTPSPNLQTELYSGRKASEIFEATMRPTMDDNVALPSPDEQDFVFVPECAAHQENLDHSSSCSNGNIPSSPRPEGNTGNYLGSLPMPVPTQKDAYKQIQRSLAQESPELVSQFKGNAVGPLHQPGLNESLSSSSLSSERSRGIPDVASISPPSVQFLIGTPPGGGRLRSLSGSSGGGTPPSQGLNLVNPIYARRNSLVKMNGNSVLSPILDFQQNRLDPLQNRESDANPWTPEKRSQTEPSLVPLGASKRCHLSYGANLNQAAGRGKGDATGLQQTTPYQLAFGSTRAFTLPELAGQEVNSMDSKDVFYNTELSSLPNKGQGALGVSPRLTSRCSSLPSHQDGPLTFVAPELPEETLFEREHNETLAKLNFVLALVDCILDLASNKGSQLPFQGHLGGFSSAPSVSSGVLSCQANSRHPERHHHRNSLDPHFQRDTACSQVFGLSNGGGSSASRQAEQLVLYMRALQLLSSSLQLSRQEVQAGRLRPSSSVRQVLRAMKERFHRCLTTCKALDSPNLLQGADLDPGASALSADRLLYDYAIEMCQSAALKELFGNPEECFHDYQTAQILLHSLSQQVDAPQDKSTLNRYKDAVEKRLFVLQSQGVVCAYETN